VEKKPKNGAEFAMVAGGALTAVAKAHAAEVTGIIRDRCAAWTSTTSATAAKSSSNGASMDVGHTPVAFGGGGYLLEVR
jgi:hypothetical protein